MDSPISNNTAPPKAYSQVEVHFSARGYYHWDIKLTFEETSEPNRDYQVIERLKKMDEELKKMFPQYAKGGLSGIKNLPDILAE